jgi:hypothetical protein
MRSHWTCNGADGFRVKFCVQKTVPPGWGSFFTWYYAGMAMLTPVAGILRDVTGAASAPLVFAGTLEIAAIVVLVLLRLGQQRRVKAVA